LVDSVTDNINFFYQDPKAKYKDKIEKLLYGGIKDIRCLILKLTDRKHNLISLEGLQPHKQIRMSFETQAIYEPLKKIFDCDQDPDIQICKTSLKNFLKQHNIQTAQKLQETLYKQSLYDIDRDTFDIVYKHTDTIVWKIEDKEMYLKLVNTKDFDEKVEVISIEQDLDGKFCSTFKYKK
jgi:GTP pyrophosphokinase